MFAKENAIFAVKNGKKVSFVESAENSMFAPLRNVGASVDAKFKVKKERKKEPKRRRIKANLSGLREEKTSVGERKENERE